MQDSSVAHDADDAGPMNRDTDPLDAKAIRTALGRLGDGLAIEVVDSCPSTNAALLEASAGADDCLLLTEHQTAGRGRRGRHWRATRGASLAMSLRRRLDVPAARVAGLSLVAGAASAQALRDLGAAAVGVKWPNDLMARDAKLGGILVEVRTQAKATLAVIGIGINVRRSAEIAGRLRRPVAALSELLGAPPSRNRIAAAIASHLLRAIDEFEVQGFVAARPRWEALHAHAGHRLRVRLGDGRLLSGIAEGLTPAGALRLRTPGGLYAVSSGRIVSAAAP